MPRISAEHAQMVSKSKRPAAPSTSTGESVLAAPAADRDPRADLQPDGRLCKLCNAADSSPDPLDGGFLWWYKMPINGKTNGAVCFYCGRTWYGHFRHDPESKTTTACVALLGQNQEKHKQFLELRGKVVDMVLARGSRTFHVKADVAGAEKVWA